VATAACSNGKQNQGHTWWGNYAIVLQRAVVSIVPLSRMFLLSVRKTAHCTCHDMSFIYRNNLSARSTYLMVCSTNSIWNSWHLRVYSFSCQCSILTLEDTNVDWLSYQLRLGWTRVRQKAPPWTTPSTVCLIQWCALTGRDHRGGVWIPKKSCHVGSKPNATAHLYFVCKVVPITYFFFFALNDEVVINLGKEKMSWKWHVNYRRN